MRYQLLYCRCPHCAAVCAECPWRLRIDVCEFTDVVVVYQAYEHATLKPSPATTKLTCVQKMDIKDMVKHGAKPARIRNELLNEGEVIPLRTLQNFTYHYKNFTLGESDLVVDLVNLVADYNYDKADTEDKPFFFSHRYDDHGRPVIEKNTAERPLVLGVTTKRLLHNVPVDETSFLFHADCTFKTNSCDFPLLVCGISDASREFHLVAAILISNRTRDTYESAFEALKHIFLKVTQRTLVVKYCVGDAEEAQASTMLQCFTQYSVQPEYIMCFFHVMQNIRKRTRQLSLTSQKLVKEWMYKMHFTRSEEEFLEVWAAAFKTWKKKKELKDTCTYVKERWVNHARFSKWQTFRTPIGYADTNNPCENFNSIFKNQYTEHMRQKLASCCKSLILVCTTYSLSTRNKPFNTVNIPHKNIIKHIYKVIDDQRIHISETQTANTESSISEDVLFVQSFLPPSDYKYPSLYAQALCMAEIYEQPEEGWAVNLATRFCPCMYFMKMGMCAHLFFALRTRKMPCPGFQTYDHLEKFESNRKRQKKKGRPARVGPALSQD